MTDQLLRFATIVAWFVFVFESLRAGMTIYKSATYQESAAFLLDKLHGRTRVFNALPSLVRAFLAAAWLCAGRCA